MYKKNKKDHSLLYLQISLIKTINTKLSKKYRIMIMTLEGFRIKKIKIGMMLTFKTIIYS